MREALPSQPICLNLPLKLHVVASSQFEDLPAMAQMETSK